MPLIIIQLNKHVTSSQSRRVKGKSAFKTWLELIDPVVFSG